MHKRLFSFGGHGCVYHKQRNLILDFIWFAFFVSFVVWFSFTPFATIIQREVHLISSQLKVLAICNLAVTIPARIVIGIVLDRYDPRLTFSGLLIFVSAYGNVGGVIYLLLYSLSNAQTCSIAWA